MWADKSWIYRVFSSFSVLFMTLDTEKQGAKGDASATVDHHLEMGKRLLAAGQLTEALSHYHSAVEGDPKNYLTYFKRATVLLALGRSKTALPDLQKVIELRPDFLKARVQRANILLKQGELDSAQDDYQTVVQLNPNDQEAVQHLHDIETLQHSVDSAKQLFDQEQYQSVIEILERSIELCPWSIELRQLRADSYEAVGEIFKAIQDLKPLTRLINDNTEGHLRISELYYELGEGEDSLKEVRECLKLDQDHKRCHNHYKRVKKLVKFFETAQKYMDEGKHNDAIFKLNAALKLENENIKFIIKAKEKMCTCHVKAGNGKDAIKLCTETIDIEKQNANAYCDRAEAHLLLDDLDAALKDYQEAQEINKEMQRAKEGINKVNKLIKQSQKRDYYKILGVSRSASKSDILRKFRKLASKWHPDKYKGDDKQKAEKKFIDLASAKEVLTDPEKRAKFDQGEDPLDPDQSGGGHNPFHGGHNPFGGGFGEGFNFKFHFN